MSLLYAIGYNDAIIQLIAVPRLGPSGMDLILFSKSTCNLVFPHYIMPLKSNICFCVPTVTERYLDTILSLSLRLHFVDTDLHVNIKLY